MRTALIALAAATIVGASVAAVSQHSSASTVASSHPMQVALCESANGTGDATNRHTRMLAEHLGLTADQRTTVERITKEACAAMATYHEQILATLTPEQREKLKQMHGHGEGAESESLFHTLFMKLHGR